ncbi:MAG TPA: putative porin [Candidatus Sulfotelmatobacter sp.]|nr:putative porin [Candidatus Sulfotelmatobacter sp.]
MATTFTGATAALVLTSNSHAQSTDSNDPVVDVLIEKGIINQAEGQKVLEEIAARRSNAVNEISGMSASKWKISDAIKSIQLYGDLRMRYEYRGVDNVPGASQETYYRERFRYAFRAGLKGDLFDDFNYGIRVETSTNPRSPWATFGNNSTAGSVTPSDKSQSGLNLGQVFLGWHPADWYEMTVGRMPMPLYTTPMVWDSDINPEGAFEKFKLTVKNVDLFADFGQFDYQDPNPAVSGPTSDVFLLAWQVGANVRLTQDMSFKIAPVFYNYTGVETAGSGLGGMFVGQGNAAGNNPGVPGATAPNLAAYNEEGLDNLLILEIPMEFNFKIQHTPFGPLQARVFGDFAYNFDGDDRADAAYHANPAAFPGLTGPVYSQNKAYQVGFGIGNAGPVYGPTQGLVYGSTAKKNTWEVRTYWQHIEQYALDVNLIDSDFFEGRGNLQGVYTAFAYSITDSIIGTLRYGYANRIDNRLGTGGNNLDIPGINPIKNYNLLQMDLTWRF